jgi:hypothetical protein
MGGIFDPDGPAAGLIRRTRVRGEGGDRKLGSARRFQPEWQEFQVG